MKKNFINFALQRSRTHLNTFFDTFTFKQHRTNNVLLFVAAGFVAGVLLEVSTNGLGTIVGVTLGLSVLLLIKGTATVPEEISKTVTTESDKKFPNILEYYDSFASAFDYLNIYSIGITLFLVCIIVTVLQLSKTYINTYEEFLEANPLPKKNLDPFCGILLGFSIWSLFSQSHIIGGNSNWYFSSPEEEKKNPFYVTGQDLTAAGPFDIIPIPVILFCVCLAFYYLTKAGPSPTNVLKPEEVPVDIIKEIALNTVNPPEKSLFFLGFTNIFENISVDVFFVTFFCLVLYCIWYRLRTISINSLIVIRQENWVATIPSIMLIVAAVIYCSSCLIKPPKDTEKLPPGAQLKFIMLQKENDKIYLCKFFQRPDEDKFPDSPTYTNVYKFLVSKDNPTNVIPRSKVLSTKHVIINNQPHTVEMRETLDETPYKFALYMPCKNIPTGIDAPRFFMSVFDSFAEYFVTLDIGLIGITLALIFSTFTALCVLFNKMVCITFKKK